MNNKIDIENECLITLKNIALVNIDVYEKLPLDYADFNISKCFKAVSERLINFSDNYKARYAEHEHILYNIIRIMDYCRKKIENPMLEFIGEYKKSSYYRSKDAAHTKILVFVR